ncbi:hypothetical protein LCI18_007202 [Fusarium solani-melongenae]|uniref:Uncharacterized protein n=1 Tax=Fusarium solani subsp. cucurbitae TaxID=2747967 RepID=A0ACD3Z527_FUSSC|nr:hypothetical protein LCI18_007202 [Fusarium solani-melongenae]
MTDFEHLSMIPGLLLAGHETTTNVLSMGLAHLLHLDLWDEASADENTLTAAIEELLRYESAITGMRRVATKDTRIGETCLRAGDSLFVAYNAGSRDQTKFCRSNQVDLSRHSKTQHLGFGRGTPYDEIEYGRVHEGRGPTRVEVAWDLPRDRSLLKRAPVPLASSRAPKRPIVDHEVVVDKIESFADSIKLLSLRSQDGKPLPTWSPGSHIDVQVGTLGYRQYSLCSNPADSSRLEIAVLREDKGAGGSQYIHENFKPGDKLLIRGPRNNFEFEAGGRRTVFIAGGIGITPIKPMVDGAAAAGLDYELIYLGKQRSGLAFVDEIVKTHGQRCTLWLSSEKSGQRLDLYNRYKNAELDGLRVYCCGPDSLLEGLEQALSHAPSGVLRLERFSNSTLPVRQEADNTVFDVVLARSGRTVHVPKDKTLLEVVNEAGAGVTSTCNKGLCGSCEVTVLEGTPEHLDVVLTASERAEGGSMMACVSRCRGSRLVLDLW